MARVGRAARLLGAAGLLPQAGTVAGLLLTRDATAVALLVGVATVYPLVILSFLGGMWWGFAMRREAGQGRLAASAVVPSLAAAALLIAAGIGVAPSTVLILTGLAVLLTLPVDAHLARTGEAPEGWMGLRVPLSLGLGGLTIAAGVLAGR